MVGDAEGALLDIEAVGFVMVDVTVRVDVELGLDQIQSDFLSGTVHTQGGFRPRFYCYCMQMRLHLPQRQLLARPLSPVLKRERT